MKTELTIILQNKLGGVATFYKNLLATDHKDKFDINLIYVTDQSTDARLKRPLGVGTEFHLKINAEAGKWRNARQLSRLISSKQGVVLVNHPIELLALTLYPKPNKTVIFLCHDIEYLQWGIEYQSVIDQFIAHNSHVFDQLRLLLPNRKRRIHLLRFGIPLPLRQKKIVNEKLKIIFLARLHKRKGVYDLLHVDEHLQESGVHVDWSVLGDGPERERFLSTIRDKGNFHWQSPATTQECLQECRKGDVFLLPSRLDGTPLALLETMSLGLVPIVYEFCPGIHTIISEDLGYVIPVGDTKKAADCIMRLNSNRSELSLMGDKASSHIASNFKLEERNDAYFSIIEKQIGANQKKIIQRPTLTNRLDHPSIPLTLAIVLRKIKKALIRLRKKLQQQ